MNRKGFTLVELIGVVVILGIIIGIAVPSYIAVSNNIRSKNYDQKIDNIKAKALEYARDYNVESITIPVKVLIEEGYLAEENPDNGDNEKITNPLGGYLDCTNIDIVRVDDSYEISISDTKNCNTEGLVNDSNILIKIYEYRDNNLGDSIGTNRNVNWTNSSKVILYADVSRISNVKENVTWSFGTKSISKSGNIATSPTSDTSYANILEVEALVFLNTEYTFSINTEDGLVSQKVLVKIDREKPSANASVSSEWTKENNKDVLISGSDGNGSGVKSYYIGDNDNVSNPEVFNLKYENDSKKDYLSVPLDVGTYYLYAIDNAGNISNSYKFTVSGIDKNGPVCKYPTGNSTWTNQNVVLTYGCNNDLGTGCAENQEQTTTIDFTAKTYPLKYTIKDNLGNETTCERTIDVFVDKTAPKCESSGGSDTWTNGTRTITGTCYDDESGCVGNVNKLYNYEMNSTTESPGVVYDKVGNSTVCPNQTVKIDKTPPTCSTSGGTSSWKKDTQTIYGNCSDSFSGCKSKQVSKTINWNYNAKVSPGKVYDNAGNSSECDSNQQVMVDADYPTCSVSGGGSGWTNKDIILTGTCSDKTSGCKSSTIEKKFINDGNYGTQSPGSVYDNVGHVTTCPSSDIKLDKTKPEISVWTNRTGTEYINYPVKICYKASDNLSGIKKVQYTPSSLNSDGLSATRKWVASKKTEDCYDVIEGYEPLIAYDNAENVKSIDLDVYIDPLPPYTPMLVYKNLDASHGIKNYYCTKNKADNTDNNCYIEAYGNNAEYWYTYSDQYGVSDISGVRYIVFEGYEGTDLNNQIYRKTYDKKNNTWSGAEKSCSTGHCTYALTAIDYAGNVSRGKLYINIKYNA